MKTYRSWLFSDCFLLNIAIILFAFFSLGTLSARAEDQMVTVGVYENAPKIFTSESGKPAGIFIDIIENIAKDEGWNLHYVSGTWGEGLDRLGRGEIDIMPDMAYTPDREKIYAFHKVPVLSSWFEVYAPKRKKINSILDLKKKRILVLERSIQQEAFARFSNGFDLNCSLISTSDYKTMFEMVAKGEADFAVTNRFYGMMHAEKYGLENTNILFEPSDLFFAAHKSDSKHLLKAIDRHLDNLKKNPQSLYYASMKRWTSEQVRFKMPLWVDIAGFAGVGFLIMSLVVSAILKHQVKVRTQELQQENTERQVAQQRFMDIIEFLPDATFVVDQDKQVIAWNKGCEAMTGVKKEMMLGRKDYAYAEPFYGERRPTLLDLLAQPAPDVEATYTYVKRKDLKVYAECFVPQLRGGQGAYLWGVASSLYGQNGHQCGAIETIRDVTEEKLMEEALRKSEREYRELVMLANSIILRWSPEGQVTFLNEFGQRFFGYSAKEIIGQNLIGTLVSESESDGRDLRTLLKEISGDPVKFERNINENIRRNGERVWIDWTNKIVLDEQGGIKEILSIGSDITVRRHAEQQVHKLNDELQRHMDTLEQHVAERTAELAAMNEEQRAILESASTGIVLLRDRIIVRCNCKLEEIAGYAPGELIGKSTRIWYPDEETFVTNGKIVYSHMAKGETYRQEQQMARKDGSLFWVRLSLCAFDKNAPFKGAVGIIEDITERREAAEKLRKALEAAQAADRIKSAFLATMSHELRTPLNSIIGFTGIMLQGLAGPLNAEQQKQMTMVQNSSRHLLSLINDVLDISKIEAGQLVLTCTSFDLHTSIEKMTKLVSPLAEKKGIELQIDLPDTLAMIATDQRRLEQVILNLLNNAIKFTERGHVDISYRKENNYYLLSFSDTGIGIHGEDLPDLFQPFHQIDTGLARKREGTGLGLSISKKILDIMGGSIEVESQWGQGSTFTIRLPQQQKGTV
ncbi:MAG: PAS domain S-box protein [Proteobacteria bacterium]|nr:PAS domain S-box protein [Pseudomonadota bacterium]